MRFRTALQVLALSVLLAAPAGADPLPEIDRNFTEAAEPLERATVLVRAEGAPEGAGSSGVVIHPEGYVLSDAQVRADKVSIRFPDGKLFKAVLVRRDMETDSALFKVENPDGVTFKVLWPGDSDGIGVGSWAMLCGNAFGTANEGRPAVSLGLISAARARDPADGAGRYVGFVTSAAVNPGSNGGPCVNEEGRLVGIVSGWDGSTASPCYGLGVIMPLDRIRARYRDLPCASKVFPAPRASAPGVRGSAVLEKAFHVVARRTSEAVVCIAFARKAGAVRREPVAGPNGKTVEIEAYGGPVSGVIWSQDGYVVTAACNLWLPETIQEASVRLRDGRQFPAKLLGRDLVRGIALLKIDAKDLPCLEPAPADKVRVGQFAFAIGNPFGGPPQPDVFLTFGMVSALHQVDAHRDALQTDAGMSDANAGGALVDLRGRLLGINTLVAPAQYGRNSGIGFAIPVARVEEALPRLKQGKNIIPGWLGVALQVTEDKKVVVTGVAHGGAAEQGGIQPGDQLVAVDGEAVQGYEQVRDRIGALMAGDVVVVRVLRGNEVQEIKATLGERLEQGDR